MFLQGHPAYGHVEGVEASTGSLGQGLSVANGMALAEKLDNTGYYTYVVGNDYKVYYEYFVGKDATLFRGVGLYQGKTRNMVYSVVKLEGRLILL